jgi:hypothetical protein
MRAGEAILAELARFANRTIRYLRPGLALQRRRTDDRLSDELDEDEGINDRANIPYSIILSGSTHQASA